MNIIEPTTSSHEQSDILDYLTTIYAAEPEILAHPMRAQVLKQKREMQSKQLPLLAFSRLNLWRIRASDTIRRECAAERARWDHANVLLAELIAAGEPLGFAFAAKLHQALGFADSSLRTERLYTADEEYLKPEHLAEQLRTMDLIVAGEADPLARAFVALVAMVTIHPFANGNGRTSRLLADAVLISEGYLPLSFSFPVASHVAKTTRGVARVASDAIETFLGGLENSYSVVLSQ
jgi:prophage maintenance system killer protein